MSRTITLLNSLGKNEPGFVTRNITEYMLTHATLSSWKYFYHEPYACDWDKATEKAYERYNNHKALEDEF